LLAALHLDVPAEAVEFKKGEQVTIAADQIIEDDLYMTGDTVMVQGRVMGDVVASGRVVRIEGTVEGDLIAAGQVVVIAGEVFDDVRIAGMTLKLAERARVGDDLFAAGFSFESAANSEVGGRTNLTGYQALVGGVHHQDLEAALVGLRIEGHIKGRVDATVESDAGPAWWTGFIQSPEPLPAIDPGLTLTAGARVEGDLSYKSKSAAIIADGAQVTGETHHEVKAKEPAQRLTAGQRFGRALRWFAVLFLVGAALLWLVPNKIVGIANTVVDRPLASLGWGVVTLLGFPVAMILILLLTLLLTIAFGLMTLGKAVALILVLGLVIEILLVAKLWIAVSYLVPAIVSFAGARWLLTRGGRVKRNRYLSLLMGLAIFLFLSLIPVLGTVVRWLVVLIGLGASALWSVRYLARSQES
jgi:hypothetical protein